MTQAPFTMDEVTAMLGCSEEVVAARIEAGELAALRYGRGWIFPREAFLESLNDAARAEAERRRIEHGAKKDAKSAITRAKKPSRRGRVAPALPLLP